MAEWLLSYAPTARKVIELDLNPTEVEWWTPEGMRDDVRWQQVYQWDRIRGTYLYPDFGKLYRLFPKNLLVSTIHFTPNTTTTFRQYEVSGKLKAGRHWRGQLTPNFAHHPAVNLAVDPYYSAEDHGDPFLYVYEPLLLAHGLVFQGHHLFPISIRTVQDLFPMARIALDYWMEHGKMWKP